MVQIDRRHLLHAVLDHRRREEVGLPFVLNRDFPVVFQEDGGDGFGGLRHVDGACEQAKRQYFIGQYVMIPLFK